MPERNNEYVYQPPAKFTEELRQRINNAGFSDEFKQQIKSAQKEEGRKMFDRLTSRTDEGEAQVLGINHKIAFARLAAYEDTGLSPEEVQELAQAKADGRLVVLPCKVGDTVFTTRWWDDVKEKCTDSKGKPFFRKIRKHKVTKEVFSPFGLDYIEWGKTVFLTREAAEKALGGGEDGSSKDE